MWKFPVPPDEAPPTRSRPPLRTVGCSNLIANAKNPRLATNCFSRCNKSLSASPTEVGAPKRSVPPGHVVLGFAVCCDFKFRLCALMHLATASPARSPGVGDISFRASVNQHPPQPNCSRLGTPDATHQQRHICHRLPDRVTALVGEHLDTTIPCLSSQRNK